MTIYYQDDYVTLYHGDCLELADKWTTADVLVTDPPYGIGWGRGYMKNAKNPTPNKGILGDRNTSARDSALTIWGTEKPGLVFGSIDAPFPENWKRMLVFAKPLHSGLVGVRIPWFRNWEPIFTIGKWPYQSPTRSAVIHTRWKAAAGFSGYATVSGHPHAKPLDVMEELISATPPDVVADPFAGSGSTLVAARNLGRKAIGVELEEKYCEIIANRLSQGAFNFEAIT